jgi:hypothetical protein
MKSRQLKISRESDATLLRTLLITMVYFLSLVICVPNLEDQSVLLSYTNLRT